MGILKKKVATIAGIATVAPALWAANKSFLNQVSKTVKISQDVKNAGATGLTALGITVLGYALYPKKTEKAPVAETKAEEAK